MQGCLEGERDCPRTTPEKSQHLSARNFDLIASSPTLFCLSSVFPSHHPIPLSSSPYFPPDPAAQATLILQSILYSPPSGPPIRAADKRTLPTNVPELPHQALLQPPSRRQSSTPPRPRRTRPPRYSTEKYHCAAQPVRLEPCALGRRDLHIIGLGQGSAATAGFANPLRPWLASHAACLAIRL